MKTDLIDELSAKDKANALDVFVIAWNRIPNGTVHSKCVKLVFDALEAEGYKLVRKAQ